MGYIKQLFSAILFITIVQTVTGQVILNSDSLYKARTPLSGRLWGYAFGDYYYKAEADSLNRGGKNEYTGINQGHNAFALRRVYLGYDFNISKKFSTHILLAAEAWSKTNKLGFFLKNANVQWHNIWKGTDLVIGQQKVPSYLIGGKIWGYRSLEREILVKRGIQTYDLGIGLKGTFDKNKNFGYHVLVGNGTGALADNNRFKKVYANFYGKFFNKKMLVAIYTDYDRFDWKPGFHHAANITKLTLGYQSKKFKIGVSGFLRTGFKDVVVTSLTSGMDTINLQSFGASIYARGRVYKDKLGFFARVDCYNPAMSYDENKYIQYKGLSKNYNPNAREIFAILGLDYTPIKNVHIMPNVWFNSYSSQRSNATGATKFDYDLVYRMTFYFIFGK